MLSITGQNCHGVQSLRMTGMRNIEILALTHSEDICIVFRDYPESLFRGEDTPYRKLICIRWGFPYSHAAYQLITCSSDIPFPLFS